MGTSAVSAFLPGRIRQVRMAVRANVHRAGDFPVAPLAAFLGSRRSFGRRRSHRAIGARKRFFGHVGSQKIENRVLGDLRPLGNRHDDRRPAHRTLPSLAREPLVDGQRVAVDTRYPNRHRASLRCPCNPVATQRDMILPAEGHAKRRRPIFAAPAGNALWRSGGAIGNALLWRSCGAS
jgi:hypothetical protein